jgi:hypothetical protein
MTLDVAVTVLKRYVDEAFVYRIMGDGHGSFTVELRDKKSADIIYDFLRSLGYTPQRLDRPTYYGIH